MQINQVQNLIKEQGAYLSTEASRVEKTGEVSSFSMSEKEGEIRSAQTIGEKAKTVLSGRNHQNHAEFVAGTITPDVIGNANQEGVDLSKEEEDVIVTVVDKIQMNMIAAGDESVGQIANFSKEQLEELSQSVSVAYQMAGQLTTPTKAEIGYMVENNLEPTIGNLYQAKAATSTLQDANKTFYNNASQEIEGLEGMVKDKMKAMLVPVTKENLERATQMVKDGLPLTKESYQYYEQLENLTLPMSQEETTDCIGEAVRFGREPQDGMLLPGYSWQERALDVAEVVANATEEDVESLVSKGLEVTVENLKQESLRNQQVVSLNLQQQAKALNAKKALEQVRLKMTADANLALIKKGIHIETSSLEKLVESLEKQEQEIQQLLYKEVDGLTTQDIVERKNETINALQEVEKAPAYLLNQIQQSHTLRQVKEMAEGADASMEQVTSATERKAAVQERASQAYDTMKTEVRRDLGDSMKKAFRNVDDILEDLGFETNEENARAVRILAYNNTELTVDNILEMKMKDEQMQSLFNNMTPKVVLTMIREGFNPLDVSLEELNRKAKEILAQSDQNDSEKYSKFLHQLEKSHEITQQERDGYIGVFRLLRQIEKGDSAAVGAVALAGEKFTLRNLMTQVRNRKAEGMEQVAEFSVASNRVSVKELSITQQIDSAYQVQCAENSYREMGDNTLLEIGEELKQEQKELSELTPEQLLEQIRDHKDELEQSSREEQAAVTREIISQSMEILHSQAEVENYLSQIDLPKTPENILALADLLKNRNKVYKDLYEAEDSIDYMEELGKTKAQWWETFSENVKSPEDMAKAQQTLAEIAESVMETMITDTEATSIDVAQMQMRCKQISMMNHAAAREEYAVPVLVQDEMGCVNLKIVRTGEEKGKVSLFMETETLGKLAAEFSVVNDRLNGYIVVDNEETKRQLEDKNAELMEKIRYDFQDVQCTVVKDESLSNEIFDKRGSADGEKRQQQENSVQTRVLYGIARTVIQSVTAYS